MWCPKLLESAKVLRGPYGDRGLFNFKVKANVASVSASKILDRYSVESAEIFITDDGRYLVKDPPLEAPELLAIENLMSDLIFLLSDEDVRSEQSLVDSLRRAGVKDARMLYFIKREVLGYGVLDPIVKDPRVEDLILPSPNIPVSVNHVDYGHLKTNVVFNEEELDRYVERIVHLSGRSISLYHPVVSLRLPDGTRFTATYKNEVSCRGSSLVMRKFPEKPWSITMLLSKNTLDALTAAWLMMLIEFKKAVLVVGGIGSGKTSMMNALCNLIPEGRVVVTVEDAQELALAHSAWIPLVVRDGATPDGRGDIGMYELVKHALRMPADYIIVGEVRGEEGRVWAQAMLTGHGGLASLHSESPQAAVERLLLDPIKIDRGGLTALHAIAFVRKIPIARARGAALARRLVGLYDFEYSLTNDKVSLYRVATYSSEPDSYNFIKPEELVKLPSAKLIMEEAGWDERKLLEELDVRQRFLRKLKEEAGSHSELLDYKVATRLAWKFYENLRSLNTVNMPSEERGYSSLGKEEIDVKLLKEKPRPIELRFCYRCGEKMPRRGNAKACPYCGEILADLI